MGAEIGLEGPRCDGHLALFSVTSAPARKETEYWSPKFNTSRFRDPNIVGRKTFLMPKSNENIDE